MKNSIVVPGYNKQIKKRVIFRIIFGKLYFTHQRILELYLRVRTPSRSQIRRDLTAKSKGPGGQAARIHGMYLFKPKLNSRFICILKSVINPLRYSMACKIKEKFLSFKSTIKKLSKKF